jgi:hypothetical protein
MSVGNRNRDAILDQLRQLWPELADRFGVERIGLFDSAAPDTPRDDSDVDVLVRFRGPATLDGYFGLRSCLEEALGRPVDLVTERGLKPPARASVARDLVHVS